MNILYIAYSCDPYAGSEDKIGWNIPLESAKSNRVCVITKEEQRRNVEKYLGTHEVENLKFYFVDIPQIYKKIFKGFLYSGRLNIWHRQVFPLAKKICEEKQIEIIHQITPIEFRAIGDYYNLHNVKFVCGPLGGGEQLPNSFREYAKGHNAVEVLRETVNQWCRIVLRITGKLSKCGYILFANRETYNYLSSGTKDDKVFFDNGLRNDELLSIEEIEKKRDVIREKEFCTFLVAGRMIYRKGHAFLLDALEQIPENLAYECRIVGSGPEQKKLEDRCRQSKKLSEHVKFTGMIPYEQMQEEYAKADVFVMPSIRETTGTVLLEAMSKGIPIITANQFGGAVLLDQESGWLYEGWNKESYIDSIKGALIECIQNPDEIKRRGMNARKNAEQYTWEKKNQFYQRIYEELMQK